MEENLASSTDSVWEGVYLPYLKEKMSGIQEHGWAIFFIIELVLLLFGYAFGVFSIIIGFWIGLLYSIYRLVYIPFKEGWMPYLPIYRVIFLALYFYLVYSFVDNRINPTVPWIVVRAVMTGLGLLIPYFIFLWIPSNLQAKKTLDLEQKYGISKKPGITFELAYLNKYERQLEFGLHKPGFIVGLTDKKNLFDKLVNNDLINTKSEIIIWRSSEGFKPKYQLIIPVKNDEGLTSSLIRKYCPSIPVISDGRSKVDEITYQRDLRKLGLFWDERRLPPTEFIARVSQLRSENSSVLHLE